jgi:cytochrome o ubiquinol oxidase subunit II
MHASCSDSRPRRRWPRRRGAKAQCLAVLFGSLALTGCRLAVLDPQGPVAAGDSTILVDSEVIMLAIVVPTIVAALGVAWWFRSSHRAARYRPDWEYSGQLELIVWGIPLLTIMLLGGVAWIGSHDLDPARPLESKTPPLNVEVVSLDRKWLFIYPDQHVGSVNQLKIPAGTPIRFKLTSASVMDAFFVPELGSMIYTMNGMATSLNLMADKPGRYDGRSTMFSGDGFPTMQFEVEAMSPADFCRLNREGAFGRPLAHLANLRRPREAKQRRGPVHLSRRRTRRLREDRPAGAAPWARSGRRDHCGPGQHGGEIGCSAS